MKVLSCVTILAVLLNTQLASAQNKCFKAVNPEVAKIEVYDKSVTESGLAADLKLTDPTQDTPFEVANLLIQTTNFTFETMALDFGAASAEDMTSNTKVFSVECDGGNMKVKSEMNSQGQNILATQSERIEGNVISNSADEGCSLGNAKFNNLIFEEVLCPVKAN